MEAQTISLSYSSQSRRSCDSISILVVDDDITCLSIVAALLKRFKYEVVTVKHPNDALCTLRIKGGGGAFDLVISDVHMPEMDGFELQQVITHEFNLPVVLMSGDNKEGVASKGMESGAAYFISKPVSPDDLRNLWQFATKKTSQVVIEEPGKEYSTSDHQKKSDDTKRKSPTDENSAQSASKKKQKVIWTNALHNRFLEAIRSIGLDRSVPKKILEVMNVPGLTRENVASHLQKYRIFLRRVSDASYKIHGDDKGLSRSFASSRITNSNRFTRLPFHNLGANTALETCFLRGSFLKPNLRHPNHIHQSFRTNLGLVQASYQTSPLLQNASLHSFDQASILGSATINSSSASTNLAGQMNYVGYKISNIKHLAESGCSKDHNKGLSGTMNLHQNNTVNAAVLSSDNTLKLDQTARFLGHSSCYVPENTDVIQDYQNLLPPSNLSLLGDLETEGLISESVFTPMNDLSEFDIMAAQQALEETDLDCYFPDIVNIQNQAQQTGGETTAGCSFNAGTNNWDSHFSFYDQASNQHDDDYLESLLAFGSFAEDDQIQTLDGI